MTAAACAVAGLLTPVLAPSPALAAGTAASASAAAPSAASASICDTYCDGRDPGAATQDRVPVSTTVDGRTIRLHLSDNDVMGWGSTDGGQAGDHVWLDRSFDGGQTWSSGSKLGDTAVPSGDTGWRTLMYNVDDWGTGDVGALRACGQPNGSSDIGCTSWARVNRNAWSRSTAAATAEMMGYHRDTGLFTGWWTSANMLTALIDNIRISGMGSYQYAISTTYNDQKSANNGNFTNTYLDDTGWWGLAWVDAYDLTGDSDYLATAKADADYMNQYWDTSVCGGGVYWATNSTYKNAVTNELFLRLNAALHNRTSGDTTYLQRAETEWTWFKGSGMINSDNLINDGITTACANNGQTTWTYNQGIILGGLDELYKATGDSSLITEARTLAGASSTSAALNPGGTLTEPGEPDNQCGSDGGVFKGVYVRNLGILNADLSDHPYSAYIDKQADTAYAHDRNSLDQYGPHWIGPVTDTGVGCQQSALDLMNASEEN